MATYFAGETLLAVNDYFGVTPTTSLPLTIYTVPTNRYAKITINRLTSGVAFFFTIGEFVSSTQTNHSNPFEEFLISEGRTLSVSPGGNAVSWYIIVREYAIP